MAPHHHRSPPSLLLPLAAAAASAASLLLLRGGGSGVGTGFFALAFNPSARSFLGGPPNTNGHGDKPKLILIGGAPGTGKSTFGMSVALDQGILKCISTDTVRAVMRSFVAEDVSPALHRSSYAPAFEDDDPVRSWKETCTVLSASVESLVDDAISRRVSLVVEGVHIVPSRKFIDRWEESGGVAIGCIIQIQNPEKHKRQLKKRGYMTGNVGNEEKKINAYERVRAIQEEMMRLAEESGWLQIEQRTEPDPLELVESRLYGCRPDDDGIDVELDEFQEKCRGGEEHKAAAAEGEEPPKVFFAAEERKKEEEEEGDDGEKKEVEEEVMKIEAEVEAKAAVIEKEKVNSA